MVFIWGLPARAAGVLEGTILSEKQRKRKKKRKRKSKKGSSVLRIVVILHALVLPKSDGIYLKLPKGVYQDSSRSVGQ